VLSEALRTERPADEGGIRALPRIIEYSHCEVDTYGSGCRVCGEPMVRRVAAWGRFTRARPPQTDPQSVPSYAQATDPELICRSAGGDRAAFEEIVTRHGTFALRLAARLIPDRSAAEDIVQEAMVRAWTQAARFDPQRAHFTTWLYRIVTNLCIDHRRRRRPEPMPEDFEPTDPAAGAQDMLEVDERDLAVAQALADLPARQRAAMALVYDEGLSGAEAARVLGLSAKAVERLLARARASLRDRLQSRDGLKGAEDVDA
jgi:RNA polymerase sigma-70 factor (ECF subfamily)